MKKPLLIVLGSFFVGLALLGILIPVLPTTPFLLLAAYFYARSSERLYRWVLTSPVLGDYIRHYREGGGVPVPKKIIAILFLWLTLGYTALVLLDPWWGKALLFAVAAGVTYHIVKIKTATPIQRTPVDLHTANTLPKD